MCIKNLQSELIFRLQIEIITHYSLRSKIDVKQLLSKMFYLVEIVILYLLVLATLSQTVFYRINIVRNLSNVQMMSQNKNYI